MTNSVRKGNIVLHYLDIVVHMNMLQSGQKYLILHFRIQNDLQQTHINQES